MYFYVMYAIFTIIPYFFVSMLPYIVSVSLIYVLCFIDLVYIKTTLTQP